MSAVTPQADTARHDARAGLAVYVHWPFCQSKCPYCDFNSHVRDAVDQARWRRALVRELRHYADWTPGRRVTSVFFGGGTPSLMAPETVADVIETVAACWSLDPAAEISLEANPGSAEAARFAAYRDAGVNRLSLGVQSFDDAALAFLGRRHDAREARAAINMARRSFPRVSFDLIYARPGQGRAAWRRELVEARRLAPEHLSVYQLTIEPGTAFHAAARRGELTVPDEAPAADLYHLTQEILEAAGLPAYEISNHARPGAECRHNLLYWQGGEYVGAGPGAHGRLNREGARCATRQHRAPEAWLAAVERDGHATRACAPLGREERICELIMMGLRLRRGIPRATFAAAIGAPPEAVLPRARLLALAEAGYLTLDTQGLRATPAGRLRLDAVLGYLLARPAPSAVATA